mmetsp:Transcript_26892/g.78628  ORF Transcript_26892/g.78628 Transcript_26892/m.78628 type:complete len:1208 (-) Transcript_26892:109-3732(-)
MIVHGLTRRYGDFILCFKVFKLQHLSKAMRPKKGGFFSNETRAFVGIVRLILSVLLFAHWAACFFWFIERKELEVGKLNDDDTLARYEIVSAVGMNVWMYIPSGQKITWMHVNRYLNEYGELAVSSPYLVATAAAWNMLVGNTNQPMQTETERVFAAAMMLLGTVVTAYMVAQISVLMTVLNASGREFSRKLDMASVTMFKLNLPPELTARVTQYYTYLWNEHGTFDLQRKFASELSPSLNAEIDIYMHQNLIKHVRFLQACSSSIIQMVVKHLLPQVFLAGDFIVHKGSPYHAMCILTRGQCSVLEDTDQSDGSLLRSKILRKYDHFGESCMLFDEQQLAPSHILADTAIDAQVLYRSDFEVINREHPELLVAMLRHIGRNEVPPGRESRISQGSESADKSQLHERKTRFTTVRMQLAIHTEFPARLIEAISDKVEMETYEPAEVVLQMRQQSVGLIFVKEGRLQVSVPSLKSVGAARSVPAEVVRVLGPGYFFGDLSLLHKRPVSANVTATTACELYVLHKQDYELLKISFPKLPSLLEDAVKKRDYEQVSPFLEPPKFLNGLSADITRRIVQNLTARTLVPGEIMIAQGDPLEELTFVAQGDLEAIVLVQDQEEDHFFDVVVAPEHSNQQRRGSPFVAGVPSRRASVDAFRGSNMPSEDHRRGSLTSGCMVSSRRNSVGGEPRSRRGSVDGIKLGSRRNSCQGGEKSRIFVTPSIERRKSMNPDKVDRRPSCLNPNSTAITADAVAAMMHPEMNEMRVREKLELYGRVVTNLVEGDVFGEMGLILSDSVAPATVRAREPSQVYQLAREDYLMITATVGHELRQRLEKHINESSYAICEYLATKCELFEQAAVELINTVSRKLRPVSCVPEESVIREGQVSSGLYLVMEGECNCLVRDADNNKKLVKVVKPGDYFGELSLLDQQSQKPASADVVAATYSQLLLLGPRDFNEIVSAHAQLRHVLMARTPQYQDYNFFFNSPLFKGASHEMLQRLMSALETRTFISGIVVQREDEQCEHLCFVASGQMIATTNNPKASLILEQGTYFGAELIYGARTKMEVQAGTDCTLYMLDVEAVAQLVQQWPSIVTSVKILEEEDRLKRLESAVLTGSPAESFAKREGRKSSDFDSGGGKRSSTSELSEQRLALVQASLSQISRDLQSKVNAVEAKVDKFEENITKKLEALVDNMADAARQGGRNNRSLKNRQD